MQNEELYWKLVFRKCIWQHTCTSVIFLIFSLPWSLYVTNVLPGYRQAVCKNAVASLGLVSPGAATDGCHCHPIFSWKIWQPF